MTRQALLIIAIALTMLGSACASSTPTAPTSATPSTFSWTTAIGPGGAASRGFSTTQAGTVTVTLSTASVPLGFGVGVPETPGAGCRLSESRVDVAGTSITVPVDKGDYCVAVYDDVHYASQIGFTVNVTYP